MLKEEFIEKARAKHGDKYDYSLVDDEVKYADKINVICSEKYPWGEPHGKFTIQVGKHLNRGDGCPKCSRRYKRTKEDFVKEANYVHNFAYTYENFKWVNTDTKGTIHCIKHNIDFEMTPCHHLAGQGCPKCRYEKSSSSKTKSTDEFIKEANVIHKGKYDYSKVNYIGGHYKVCIICPEHGEFWQTPNNHIHKTIPQGCPICGQIKSVNARTYSKEEFITKCNEVHDNKYNYSKIDYVNTNSIIGIVCPKHNIFYQKAANHLSGQGCPKCSCFRSKGEREVEEYIKSLGFEVRTTDRTILEGTELDITVPSKNIAIEYDGLRWHSEDFKSKKYHLEKTKRCAKKGYRLIHIFEDEWINKKLIVKSRLRNILGKTKERIYARKCNIVNINPKTTAQFLNENHIQGACASSVRVALLYNNEIVSLMTFGHLRYFNGRQKDKWELLRFCNKLNTSVIGGASRLLSHFIKDYRPKEIISYADIRWSDGGLYETLGFEKYNESPPNYFYIVNGKREYRFKYRKSELVRQGFDPSKSESEIMREREIPRVYDCGCLCYRKTFETTT